MEIDCTGLDKIIKNIHNLCKIIRNDLGKIGMKNSIFEKIKIDFYRNELVYNWKSVKMNGFLGIDLMLASAFGVNIWGIVLSLIYS